jgi:hypothetical protein
MYLAEFPFADVATWLVEGKVIPFLGAGASLVGASGLNPLPDGRSLVNELIDKMGKNYPGEPTDGLAKVAEYFEQRLDRLALFDYLHDRFYQQQLNAPLGRVAQLLAEMPESDHSRFIVTTNYDNFVERAFQEAGRPICVITQNMRNPERGVSQVSLKLPDGSIDQVDALMFQWGDDPRFPPGTTYLFKMHGSADRRLSNDRDDLIITENDYVDFLVNSGGSVSPLFPPVSLLAAFGKRRFLFLGYSLADWNFRAFFQLLALRNALSKRDYLRHWAVQHHPNEVDVKLWEKRNVRVCNAELLQFCDRLETVLISEHAP